MIVRTCSNKLELIPPVPVPALVVSSNVIFLVSFEPTKPPNGLANKEEPTVILKVFPLNNKVAKLEQPPNA